MCRKGEKITFKEWEKDAESIQTMEVNRDTIRDIYPTPNRIELMHDLIMPRSIFKPQREVAVVCYTVTEDKEASIKAAGGELSGDYYTDEGFGTPVFFGEGSLEKAFNYAQTLKECA